MRINMIGPWLKRRLGRRTIKIGLDINLGCPQHGGRCIYCSAHGASQNLQGLDLPGQLARNDNQDVARLAYFQAHSSTNAPASSLQPLFYQAATWPGIAGIIISTRPDCLDDEHWRLLGRLRRERHLCWLELGLQSANDETLRLIQRGHDAACFSRAVARAHSLDIAVVAHVILGLPGEAIPQIEATARLLADLNVWGVKLHSLMVLRDTELAGLWRAGRFSPWDMQQWIEACARFLSLLPPATTIHRLSADPGSGEICLAPQWVHDKNKALTALRRYMEQNQLSQGCACQTAGQPIEPSFT